MSRSSRRKSRSGVPSVVGVRFDDSDGDQLFKRSGEGNNVPSSLLPRAPEGVRRLLRYDSSSSAREQGYGAVRPMQSVVGARWSALRGLVTPVPRRPKPFHAKPAFGPSFNVVRVPFAKRVAFCVRRKQRKEVLFAKRVAGRGARSPGPYKRSFTSRFTC